MPLLVSFLQPRRLRVSRLVSAEIAVMPLLVMLLQSCSAMNLSLVILAMLSMPLQELTGSRRVSVVRALCRRANHGAQYAQEPGGFGTCKGQSTGPADCQCRPSACAPVGDPGLVGVVPQHEACQVQVVVGEHVQVPVAHVAARHQLQVLQGRKAPQHNGSASSRQVSTRQLANSR